MNNTVLEENAVVLYTDALARNEKWIAARDTMLARAATIATVETETQLDESGALQTEIGKHIRDLERERKAVTEPIDKLKKDIMAQEKEMRANLERERDRLKRMNDAYATRLAIEAEAERKRLRIEEEHRRQEEAQRQMDAMELFGEEAAIEVPAPPPPPAPIPEAPKLSNNRMVKRWSFSVTDPQLVPREFLVVDDMKIRGHITYCAKMDKDPVIPGVRFEAHMSVEGR